MSDQSTSASRNVRTNRVNMRVVHNACHKGVVFFLVYLHGILEEKGMCDVGKRADTPSRGYQKTTASAWDMMRMCA
jgi:hypothetical protein